MKAIYFGKKVYLRYQLEKFPPPLLRACIVKDFSKWEHTLILEMDTDAVHEKGQTVFFPDLDKDVKVLRVSTNVNGGFVYWMDHTVELVEDEITKESLTQAENHMKDFETFSKKIEESHGTIIPYESAKKSWFSRWFS